MRIRLAATALFATSLLAGLALSAGVAAPAAAKGQPCWERVINDWLDNGTIDHRYKAVCYQQALKHVPEDLRDYSNISDAISAALQNALTGKNGPGSGGSGSGDAGGVGGGDSAGGPAGKNRELQAAPTPNQSYYRRAINNLGSTSADSLPIPLLVLAGLGTALLLTAGGLATRKRLKARAPKPPGT
jgi:hypothetical protein